MSYNYKNLIKSVDNTWLEIINKIFDNEEGVLLFNFLSTRDYIIYPYPDKVFDAFRYFSFDKLQIVLLGQDPYIKSQIINDNEIPQAMGLSFSVPKNIKIPPSLRNIFKELKNSHPDFNIPEHGDLTKWVINNKLLLLNSSLTTKKGKSNYHQKKWMKFTDKIIKYISDYKENVIFILLGNFAKSKSKLINKEKHYILDSSHPSPLSCYKGFNGSNIFNKLDDILTKLYNKKFNYHL